jgi:hypothetical protein
MSARKPVPSRRGQRRPSHGRLVEDVAAFIRRYVVLSDSQLVVVALWTIHTHAIEASEQTPYLAITSPEKQCGKTRLLETLELVCARPWVTLVPSEAVLFRHIHQKRPTLLLDEVDTIFNPRSADRYEGHRALLNAGHRRGTRVPRCVGTSGKIAEFEVFCAKALAGIGTLPETIADRSIPIRLSRRKRDEEIAQFKRRTAASEAEVVRQRIEAWTSGDGTLERLRDARPSLPDELSDRMQDGCEGLIAIADAAGQGAAARDALVELLTGERVDDQETMRIRLLRDTKAIFAAKGMPKGISTNELIDALVEHDESPWSNYYGRRLGPRDLAALLKHYGVSSTTIRKPARTLADRERKKPFKGYKRDDLHDPWVRYL